MSGYISLRLVLSMDPIPRGSFTITDISGLRQEQSRQQPPPMLEFCLTEILRV